VEVDQRDAVGADHHAEHEHQHQAGQPQPAREERGGDARGEQRAHRQCEETDFFHRRTFSEERV
jgi:hypothetical protein